MIVFPESLHQPVRAIPLPLVSTSKPENNASIEILLKHHESISVEKWKGVSGPNPDERTLVGPRSQVELDLSSGPATNWTQYIPNLRARCSGGLQSFGELVTHRRPLRAPTFPHLAIRLLDRASKLDAVA
jgi:hypothetical protein